MAGQGYGDAVGALLKLLLGLAVCLGAVVVVLVLLLMGLVYYAFMQ